MLFILANQLSEGILRGAADIVGVDLRVVDVDVGVEIPPFSGGNLGRQLSSHRTARVGIHIGADRMLHGANGNGIELNG